MKKNYSLSLVTAIGLMFLGTIQAFAVDYTISFTGTGKSTTVGSVIVQNLTKGTTATVPGGSSLTLTVVAGLDQLVADKGGLRIYSNAVDGNSTVLFMAKNSGSTQISAYGLDGRKIVGRTENLLAGQNSFQVSLQKGAYFVRVDGVGYSFAAKLINQSSSKSNPQITMLATGNGGSPVMQKSKSTATAMDYTIGDQLLYKGISGNYATIVTDIPTASKTVNFNFIECLDADGNYYAVVKIGTQTWMAENMRTTKYRTGTIPNITVAADWGNTTLVTGAWCYLNGDATNNTRIGKLYNWFAVNDTRNIAPVGWHVPSIVEYTTLGTFLGGFDVAGLAMKETGTTNWLTDAFGSTNSSGFSARASGKCNSSGVMNDFDYNYLWTNVEFSATNGTCAFLAGPNANFDITYSPGKRNGFSLRCIMD